MPAGDYIVTIGLEVHCQLRTASKMFCACPAGFGADPNTLTCPVCLGLPGSLPVLNAGAIEKTILAGLMLGCTIPEVVKWDRKNYYYPDMPRNYQISQYDLPLCVGGRVPLFDSAYPRDWRKKIESPGKSVGLTRIHLEEDVGKSTHLAGGTVIDFNRAGTPLMEIVSEPEIASAEEAVAYLNSLRQILLYGDLSDADMEKGQMRCDVNISLRPRGQAGFGPKIELKNLNSVSAVRRAIRYEIERQADELDRNIPQVQSTRRWDDDRGETTLMRTKEYASDYRYLPDPDLLPVHTAALVEAARAKVPELPQEKRERFIRDYGISEYDAEVLTADRPLADYFEQAAAGAARPKTIANWILNDLLGALSDSGTDTRNIPVPAAHIRELAGLTEAGTIHLGQAKEVFAAMLQSGSPPAQIVREMGLAQDTDASALEALIDQVLADNRDTVGTILAGNEKAVNALKGQVMKLSRGRANPRTVSELLEARIRQLATSRSPES